MAQHKTLSSINHHSFNPSGTVVDDIYTFQRKRFSDDYTHLAPNIRQQSVALVRRPGLTLTDFKAAAINRSKEVLRDKNVRRVNIK